MIVDAPGHRQFLRNMITGAADAEAAVLVVDAQEGAREQTRRHAMLLHLIGIRHVIVLLNKVDLLDFDQAKVEAVEKSVTELLNKLGLEAALFVPASARDGDNIASRSERSPWYKGPTLTEALASVPSPASRSELALRLPVQDVYRFDNTRYVAGRVERGRVRVGDTVIIGTQKTPARIASIESWHTAPHVSASAGQSIAVTLEPDVIPDRGDLLHHADAAPMEASRVRVRLFWLRQEPLRVGEHFRLRLATAEHAVTVTAIDKVVDLDDLTEHPGTEVPPEGLRKSCCLRQKTFSLTHSPPAQQMAAVCWLTASSVLWVVRPLLAQPLLQMVKRLFTQVPAPLPCRTVNAPRATKAPCSG